MPRRADIEPAAGPNDAWWCDGHKALITYGFAIWGFRDKFSGKWLGLWVLPSESNSSGTVAAYLWLTVVRQVQGKCSGQTRHQTDGEYRYTTTVIRHRVGERDELRACKGIYVRYYTAQSYHHLSAYRKAFSGEDVNPRDAVQTFSCAIDHMPKERAWVELNREFGHRFPNFWDAGSFPFDVKIEKHKRVKKLTGLVMTYSRCFIGTWLAGSGRN